MNAVFAGTFDPFTLGHLDIAKRAAKIYDKVFIAIAKSDEKHCMFDLAKREEIVKVSLACIKNVHIYAFDGLLTEFCKERKCNILVRGLRTVNDFEYERALAFVYKDLNPEIESVFFINNPNYSHIHSSLIRQLIVHKADISSMVHEDAVKLIFEFNKGM